MKNKLIICLLALSVHTMLPAQTMTFRSTAFEAGVRQHIGLAKSEPLTAAQLDTITQLDLSAIGLTDIQDIRLLRHLRTVDLSYNQIDDIRPLMLMASLREVNLSNNQLESINMLAFSDAEEMEVDVSFNYITDFSIFNTLTPCLFTIEGAGLQAVKDTPYFLVRYLYSDGTTKQPAIYYRVDATTTEPSEMTVQGVAHPVLADNAPHVVQLNSNYYGTRQVMVSDGIHADSTYLVTLKKVHVDPGKSVRIATSLPDDYELRASAALNGTLYTDGTDLTFKAYSAFDYEEVIYTFHSGGELKGVAKVILTKDAVTDGIDTPTDGEAVMNIALNGDILGVRCPSSMLAETSVIEVCDVAGRVIVSQSVDSSRGLNEQIRLPRQPRDIIIVRVTSGQKRFVDKLTTRQ